MSNDPKKDILDFIEKDQSRPYTIPDIQKGTNNKNREKVVIAVRELEYEGKIRSWKKGRTNYYHVIIP